MSTVVDLEARRAAAAAEDTANIAGAEARAATIAVGRLTREVSLLGQKVDGAVGDVRDNTKTMRDIVNGMQDLAREVRGGMRRHGAIAAAPGPTRASDPPPKSAGELAQEYGLRAGDTGTFRVDPDTLESFVQRLNALEQEKHDAVQRMAGADALLAKWKGRVMIAIAITGALGTLATLLAKFHVL